MQELCDGSSPSLLDMVSASPSPRASAFQVRLAEIDPLVVSDAPLAAQLAAEVAQEARGAGDSWAEGQALCLQAGVLYFQANHEAAEATYWSAHRLAQRTGDRKLEARAVNGLGLVAHQRADYAGELELYLQSLHLAQAADDEVGQGRALSNIGVLRAKLGDHAEALRVHQEAAEVAERGGDPTSLSSARVNIVVDYHMLGNHTTALAVAEHHLPEIRRAGLRQHEVVLRSFCARSLLELERTEEALMLAGETLTLAEEIGERNYACSLLLTLGRVHLRQGHGTLALPLVQRALALATEFHIKTVEVEAHAALADLYEAQGEGMLALQHLRAHHELERLIHTENVDRKTRMLTAQFQMETLKREAEMQRLRSERLSQDNSALRQDRELLAHRAAHDTLTGLANRAHFQAEAEQALRERGDGQVAVLFIDLDRFKVINDTLGHDAGDELLRQMASRLKTSVRRDDLVARLGGDEFTVLLRHLRSAPDAGRVGRKLLEALAVPFTLGNREVEVTASIGIAVAPGDGESLETLQQRADEAMYRVKHGGKNGVGAFSDDPS
ncbi:diguanylate cyclase (GGDEF) domain-containing protein [Deinococcus hopiensis KR-140]|uniref:Diguanylate cyclase (GGDEF) domain-containing protein n=2 Tax=Deinococcus TaxID=1298 RepID=A0A1W1UW56_9DEIO|nr:diguanylate cyclase (GGDEF) domain-containing protein [Deinococcus hopiensis KR-140]